MKRLPRIFRFLTFLLLISALISPSHRHAAADADAEALLTASASAMGALTSFHFLITVDQGELVILDRLELVRAEGDVEQPHTLKVSVNGTIKVLPVTANVIIIGDDMWAAVSPREDKYSKIDPDRVEKLELSTAFDPTSVLLKAIEYVDNPVVAGTEDLDGVATTIVEGTVDLSKVDSGTPRAGLVLKPVSVRIWLDGSTLVHRLQVIGQLLESEPEGIVHQLDLSKFNEPVEIVAP